MRSVDGTKFIVDYTDSNGVRHCCVPQVEISDDGTEKRLIIPTSGFYLESVPIDWPDALMWARGLRAARLFGIVSE